MFLEAAFESVWYQIFAKKAENMFGTSMLKIP